MQRTMLRGVALAVSLALSACGGDDAPTGAAGKSGTGAAGKTPNAVGSAANTPPVVSNGTLQTVEDTVGMVSINATDADGDALFVSIRVAPTKGTAGVSGSGPFQFFYIPNPNANGDDTFEFQVNDGKGGTANGQVSVSITSVADPIVMAGTQAFSANEDAVLNDRVVFSEPDGDPLTWNVTQTPAHGTLQLQNTGQFTYQPIANFSGSDSFSVEVSDGTTNAASVINLTVQSVNDTPVVVGEDVTWPLDATSTVDVLANDSDIEGGALTVELVNQPPGASATVSGGEISVTPAAGMSGPTHVEYRVTDADGGSATGRVRVIFGSMLPFFYRHFDGVTRQDGVRRYDYFSQRAIATPGITQIDRFNGFITNADATKMVYYTIRNSPTFPRRLYLKDLTDDSAPVQEIETGGGMPVDVVAISPDGNHIAFQDKYAHASRPGQPVTIAAGAQRPRFSQDGQYLFYTTVSPSGSRAIHRAEVDPVLGPTNHVQITATYAAGEGLGVDYWVTADETKVVSLGSFNVPGLGTKQPLYVSQASGPVNDVRLHPQFSTSNDVVEWSSLTRDSRYAFYRGTFGGTGGLYTSDLQAPGTAVLMAADINSFTRVSDFTSSGDSSTLFYAMLENLFNKTWHYMSFGQPGISTPFLPLGPSQARILRLYPAPDNSHVAFTIGDAVYSTAAPYTSATTLLATGGSSSPAEATYAPDSSVVVVRRQSEVSRLYVLNPKAPGWIDRADPGGANDNSSCAGFPGQGC